MIDIVQPTDRIVCDLSMLPIDRNDAKLKALRRDVAEKYGVPVKNVTINFKPIVVNEKGERVTLTSDIITSIQDPKFQQQLFREYIDTKEIKDIVFDDILDIDNKINAFVDFDSYSKYKSYKFKYVKWNNYLSYGKDNYFDFTTLKGLTLLCSNPQNQGGKTSFGQGLLRFALFGKTEKSPDIKQTDLSSIFNRFLPEETEVMVEAGLEIEGEDYVIRRTVTRPALKRRTSKSKCKQKVEYFKRKGDSLEEIENCEGENTSATNNIIRDSIGTVEDFDLIISATSYTLGNLLRMGQADKGRLFSRWLGLLSIEEKEKIAKDYYKTKVVPTLVTSKYDKATLQSEIDNMRTVIEDDKTQILKLQEEILKSTDIIEGINKNIIETVSAKKEIKESLIKTDVATIENQIQMTTDALASKRGQFNGMKQSYIELKDVTFDEDKYKKIGEDIIAISGRNGALKQEIANEKKNIEHITSLIEQKVCPTCGHKVDVEAKTKDINECNEHISKLVEEGVSNKAKLDELSKAKEVEEENRTKVEKLNQLKLSLTALKAQIDNDKLRLEQLNVTKGEIETNKENIRTNNEIDSKIRLLNEQLRVETRRKDDLIRNNEAYKSEISRYEGDIKNRDAVIAKLTEEEKIIRNWNVYQELIGKNGILKIVLKQALPIINNEISSLLDGLCDFNVVLSISDDNKVCLDLVHDGVTMDLGASASGFEGTMASLALRSALATVSSFARPNLLVLDEVLEGVGDCNFDNIHELYMRIAQHYDFILHITHKNMLADWHNQTVCVTKENNVSRIAMG